MGKRVAAVLADMFEDSEFTYPADALRRSGHQVVVLGMRKGIEVTGKKKGTRVELQERVSEADPDSFDALLIPGGYSPDKLRAHDEPVDFVRKMMEAGKPVFAICHGPQLLISADALSGRRLAGWRSIRKDIENAGAEYADEPVVRDGNLISSRHPGDLQPFTQALLEALEE